MTMRERIRAGMLFTDECEGLPQERVQAKKRMRAFNATDPEATEERFRLMEEIFGCPVKAWIEPPFYFCYGRHISIGDGTYINFNCNFVDDGQITIGEQVMFGPGVTIATVSHPIAPQLREYMFANPVIIGDRCWIGGNVTICPGVTIGEGSVIGAGSVVTRDVPANCVAVGNPCRVLRKITEKDLHFYGKGQPITKEDLEEEARLRGNK